MNVLVAGRIWLEYADGRWNSGKWLKYADGCMNIMDGIYFWLVEYGLNMLMAVGKIWLEYAHS